MSIRMDLGDGWVGTANDAAGYRFGLAMQSAHRTQTSNAALCSKMLARGYDVSVITPDDGWVDRRRNTVTVPSYAQVLRKPKTGDLIALGHSTSDEHLIGRFRICRVLGVEDRNILLPVTTLRFVEETPAFNMTAPERF